MTTFEDGAQRRTAPSGRPAATVRRMLLRRMLLRRVPRARTPDPARRRITPGLPVPLRPRAAAGPATTGGAAA